MTTRIGVNGFGRIGRLVTRATMERYPDKLEVAAVNDLTDDKTNAHLFKYDTSYGVYQGQVEASNGDLLIDGRNIKVFSERDPARIPWSEMGVDLVVESTGIFTDGAQAAGHMEGGASKVIISAPASNVPACTPATVRIGSKALRSECRPMTTCEGSPFARAVRT